jgi:glycosyltransferase involved in cell wall biosynthesis
MDSAVKDACDYTVRMHIGLDIREACRAKRAGKGQWTFGFTDELLTRDQPLTLYTDAELPSVWRKIVDASAGKITVRMISARGFRWHLQTARDIRSSSIDAYVSTVSYIVPFLIGKAKNVVPVVHDLIAFRDEPHDKRATMIERLTLARAMRTAYAVCTVSDTTKHDLLSQCPSLSVDRVVPIYAAPIGHVPAKHAEEKIILCIATLCPRKNQLRLIEAYAQLPAELKKKHPLILVGGRGWQDEEIVKLAQATDGVEWKSYLSDDECKKLMSETIVFAYPSLYEGFGLPILEAMASGVPVLTSNLGSMKEVADDAALTVNPSDTHAIRDDLKLLLTDAALRKDLRKKGMIRSEDFSWKRTVDLFLAAMQRFDSAK